MGGRRRKTPLGTKLTISLSNGGHNVVKASTGKGWLCTICSRRSTKRWRLLVRKCERDGKKEWANAANGHTLYRSGNIVWCSLCGAFAETRANRLQKVCLKKPPEQYGSGGVRCQLNRLKAGLHPVTRCRLPPTTWADGSAVRMVHGYLRKTGAVEVVDDKFVRYEPEEPRTMHASNDGKSASDKRRLYRGRVLLKESSAARAAAKGKKYLMIAGPMK